MTIGENIRYYRKLNNMSAKSLADKLNCSAQAILQYERNERKPSLEILTNISNILSIPIEVLINSNYNDFYKNTYKDKNKFGLFNNTLDKDNFANSSYIVSEDFINSSKTKKNYNTDINLKNSLFNFIKYVDSNIDLENLDDKFINELSDNICDLIDFKLYKYFNKKD